MLDGRGTILLTGGRCIQVNLQHHLNKLQNMMREFSWVIDLYMFQDLDDGAH